MTKLLFQGHGSYRIITNENLVIYVDPYAGTGYDIPADIILVTHQHSDHNQIQLAAKKEDCVIIQNFHALKNNVYKCFDLKGIHIESVPAYNSNHDRMECVGYMLTFDDLKVYASGDTSITQEMREYSHLNIDYALLPIDGIYNMDPMEASACADLIGAKHVIPIHMTPNKLFDEKKAEKFTAVNKLIVKPGEEIELNSDSKLVIDRFEGNFAVCEKEDETMINIEKTKIPHQAKEGDVLILRGNQITIDKEDTQKRRKEIEELTKNLWV